MSEEKDAIDINLIKPYCDSRICHLW